jgi:hypothetical protein
MKIIASLEGSLAGMVSLFGLLVGCGSQAPEIESAKALLTAVDIPIRVFSTSPSLGAKPTSVTDPNDPSYGALKVFFDKATQLTGGVVGFSIAPWQPTAPNSVIRQVGISGDPTLTGIARDAAYDNGGALNPLWGFVYNSVPFGLSFDLMVQFLYEHGGLALAQTLVDARALNVDFAYPAIGHSAEAIAALQDA